MASAMITKLNPVQCARTPRFVEGSDWCVWDMALGADGSVALSGWHEETWRTFIDLLYIDPDSTNNCKMIFTKEFNKSGYGCLRCVSYISSGQIVTCCNDTIELIDYNQQSSIKSRTFSGEAAFMAVSEEGDQQIFVGLRRSNKVIVFRPGLTELKTITLTGLDRSYVDELGVMGAEHTLCVRTIPGDKPLLYNINGDVQTEPLTAMDETEAESIAVHVSSELAMVLWYGRGRGHTLITAHHIPSIIEGGRHSSLADRDGGRHSSLAADGRHIIVYFQIDQSSRIRIKNNRLISVGESTGELKEYAVEDIFSLPTLLPALSSTINENEVTKLANYFTITSDQSITDIRTLVQHLTDDLSITPQNIIHQLISACRDLGLNDAASIMSIYQKQKYGLFGSDEKLLALEAENQRNVDTITSLEEKRASLEKELTTTKQTLTKSEETQTNLRKELDALIRKLTEELDQTKETLAKTINNLHQSELRRAQESKALEEVLQQTKQALVEQEKAINESDVPHDPEDDEHEDHSAIQVSTLVAGFGRLQVAVDEHLTLDNSLKLAMLFELPPSKVDFLRRISFVETPGCTLLDILKERDIINMYDVTNLQKALISIHLKKTNDTLLVPYQESVSKHLFEQHRAELLQWPEEEEEQTADDEEEQEDTEGGSSVVAGEPDKRYHNPSLEQMIGTEGGTISVAGVNLSVPRDALTENHVIAAEVIREPEMNLPGGDNRSRITPLIKLGPLKLEFQKPVTVTIPHCAVIPDVHRHSVIVYSGQQSEGNNREVVTWAEESSAAWKLFEETVEISLTCLSFLSISLVSEEIVQKHILRVVSFVDGITTPEDDIIITCCLCKDNDEEFKSLIDDHKSMLSLGKYATHQIIRSWKRSDVSETELEMSLELNKDSAYFIPEESSKQFDIDHACEASRVSQQFRLRRKKGVCVDTTILDAKLTVRHGDTSTESLLQTKVRSLVMSAESKNYLLKKPDVKPYVNLKRNIASQLSKHHCEKLCMYFDFAPAVKESILGARDVGMELMTILDERELIMPKKMMALYEGLTGCDLNRIARMITEYTAELNKTEEQPKQEQKIVTTKPSKVKILMEEGFTKTHVIQALNLSQGRVDLGRKILQVIDMHKERLPALEPRVFYKEQFFSKLGGDLLLSEAGVSLVIPPGCLTKDRIVNLSVVTELDPAQLPGSGSRLCQIVKCGPEEIQLKEPASLRIPYCGMTGTETPRLTIYGGQSQRSGIDWKDLADCEYKVKDHYFELEMRKFGMFCITIKDKTGMRKQMRALPLINRITSPTDDLIITLWLFNSDDVEHQCLLQEETIQHGKIQLDQHSTFTLTPARSQMSAQISIPSRGMIKVIDADTQEIDRKHLWTRTRHKVEFRLKNEGCVDRIALNVSAKLLSQKNPFCNFKVNIEMKKLLSPISGESFLPVGRRTPTAMVNSFDVMKRHLASMIDKGTAVHIAAILGLPADLTSIIRRSKTPGVLLLDKLVKKAVISAAKVSPLEGVLMNNGNVEEAELVQRYREKNVVVSGLQAHHQE